MRQIELSVGDRRVHIVERDAAGEKVSSVELLPRNSQRIVNHSPDGFNWGYGGSGPAQLALAILLEVAGLSEKTACKQYHDFKWEVVSNWTTEQDSVYPLSDLFVWLEGRSIKPDKCAETTFNREWKEFHVK